MADLPDTGNLTSAFQDQAAAHKKAREDLLENALRTTDVWIGAMKDPEVGPIGQQFIAKAKKSGCKQEIDIFFTSSVADYTSFSYNPRNFGFVNEITFGPAAEESLPKLYSAKVHETDHAFEKMECAALHASPFNPNTKIIICPRDWVTLEERCEQDAYTKQAWFNTMLAAYLPEVREKTEGDPVSVAEFEKIKANTPNIQQALIEAARQSLNKSFYSDNPGSEYRFRNCIQDQALKNYAAGMAKRQSNGETNLVFVRLEPEDIAAIGASLGPNIFGSGGVLPEFLEKPKMLQATCDKLAEVNKTCDITNEDALPTLTEALKAIGLTREQFIAQAYQSKPAAPASNPPPPAPIC